MKKQIKTIERVEYSEKCHICKKNIKGLSESAVKYNLKTHLMEKHQNEKNNN